MTAMAIFKFSQFYRVKTLNLIALVVPLPHQKVINYWRASNLMQHCNPFKNINLHYSCSNNYLKLLILYAIIVIMKKHTIIEHSKIANRVMYYIYRHIDSNINIDELAKELAVSKFHLHKIFKEQMGANIYESIKSIRLQKAANLLITNKNSTIMQIASMCGYSSQSSFIRVFKERFNYTPTHWRKGKYLEYSSQILKQDSKVTFENIEPEIVKMESIKAYYIRHKGYDKSIKSIWQKLQAWSYSNNLTEYKQVAVYHDNPVITPLADCNYIASISTEEKPKSSSLAEFKIPAGLYAKFSVSGEYGDILKFIQWVYHSWLPKSGYETTPMPSFSIFKKNHFLSADSRFDIEYYLPIIFA